MAAVRNNTALGKYSRHHPEQGLLYRIVETYWPIFLREQQKVGRELPLFIKDEFEKFLHCGIAEFGFVRTYCYQCKISGIVDFSCKKRGFCPSCCARRMNDEAAHLVDQVLPEIIYRQWVLSFPYKLRFLMAHNANLTNKILSVFIQGIGSYQKKQAKKFGIPCAWPGSVTFIQRFGSALNLNVHFHALFADGVYHKTEGGYEFFKLPQPTQEELNILAEKIQCKVLRLTQKLGFNEQQDQIRFDENALGEMAAASISHKATYGDRVGKGLRRYGTKKIEVDPEWSDPFSVNVGGFSLNARVWIAGKERDKLEKLIRYMARGPIATERLSESFPNMLIYKMKTKWRDGTTHVSFSYLDFIARLVALIPPPKMNMVRYHGVFAPNFKDRNQIVPKPKTKTQSVTLAASISQSVEKRARRERMRWSDMLKRTFKVDVTVCPRCLSRLEQIAVIKDRVVAKAILESLWETTIFRPLAVVRDRGPPNGDVSPYDEFDQRGSW